MAWNEPGNNNKDPWGNQNKGGDGPPDFDEILRNLFSKFGGGKKGSGSGQPNNGSFFVMIMVAVVVAVLFYVGKGLGVVNEQERAVILRFGLYKETKGPGLQIGRAHV
jgi:membrane protease subunit HflK